MKQNSFPVEHVDYPPKFRPVIEHACQIILKNGIRTFTIDRFCSDLKISKKTVYKYFRSREAFIEYILRDYYNQLFDRIQKMQPDDDPVTNILQILAVIFRYIEPLSSETLYDIKRYYPRVWQQVDEFRSGFVVAAVKDYFKAAQKRGLIRKEINIDFATILVLNIIQTTFQPEIFVHIPYSITDMMRLFIDLILNGFMSPGQKFDITVLDRLLSGERETPA